MVVLGLILVLVAVAAGVVLVYENSGSDHTISISAFGGQWNADAYWLAIVGAAILLVAVLGIALMRSGGKRGLRRRQERKQLERENAALADRVRHTPAGDRVDHPGRHDDAAHAAQPYDPDPRAERGSGTYDQPPTAAR